MLSLLKIKNIALIDELAIEFGEGLNLLTGETGSGKSIIVDSLGALTGERVSNDLIKEGEQSASIEGLFAAGERALVVDDIATRGDAKLEALVPLAEAGLTVSDVVVLVDREQGARALLAARGIALHAAVTLRELVGLLAAKGRISSTERDGVLAFLSSEAGVA